MPRGVDRGACGRPRGRGGRAEDGKTRSSSDSERENFSTITAYCTVPLLQDRFDEVAELCPVIRETSPADDLINFV